MRARATALFVVVAAAGTVQASCRAPARNDSAAQAASLGGDVAARVSGDGIPVSLVREIAAAQGLDGKAAVGRAIDDAVMANGARERGLDQRQPTAWRLRAAQAKLLVDRTFDEAKARGLPSDDEVNAISERHWVEVDRPPSVRTMHAIVIWQPKSAVSEETARRLAERIHAAVAEASDEEFEAKAQVAREAGDAKLDVKVERLPAFTEKGLVVEGPGAMDAAFAKAAYALPKPGSTSAVVHTSFGFHVIRLLERLPEARMPFEQRRLAFAEEVYSARAREALEKRLGGLRGARPVTISPAAEPLMRAIAVAASAP